MSLSSPLLFAPSSPPSTEWQLSSNEGQLALDVFRENDTLVIRSTVAGVVPEDLDIALHGDLLTIRGTRRMPEVINQEDLFYQECYWGAFSRSIILPVDVYPEQTDAQLKNGVLEIRLPIRQQAFRVPIRPREDG